MQHAGFWNGHTRPDFYLVDMFNDGKRFSVKLIKIDGLIGFVSNRDPLAEGWEAVVNFVMNRNGDVFFGQTAFSLRLASLT